ncbi:DUF3592 domain-containing protein [Streptomyces sp. NPDC006798]|uniref:DUF3592 domain-containing protein n=1 Tax=Streptomyces sp. NPDC006798 TaxID=3155462 RepID=UPI0033D39E4A
MPTVFAAFTVLGGLVAVLAGAHGLRRTRRIRHSGRTAEALVKPPPPGADRELLEYVTEDGRVVEIPAPVPLDTVTAGSTVPVSYDPADPRDVVVLGRERTALDRAFVVAGLLVMAAGPVVAVLPSPVG